MNKNFKKIVSMVLLLAMVLSVVVIVPVAAAELEPLEEGNAFIVCRTIDEEGNPTNVALYTQNQKVIFEIRAFNFSLKPVAVAGFNYSLFADGSGKNAIDSGFVAADPETGIALVETTTMAQPGLFRLTAEIADAAKNTLSGYAKIPAGVMVDAQSITTTASPIPAAELRQVWDEQLAMQVAPEILKITKLDSDDNYDVYAIYIDSIGNPADVTRPAGLAADAVGPQTGATHAFAHMTVPKGAAAGSLNIKANVQGYGVSSGYASKWDKTAITISISAHSLEAVEKTEQAGKFKEYYTSWLLGGGNYGFDNNGLTTNANLETNYFRNMLLRDVNAVLFGIEAFGEKGATISDKYDETAPRTMPKAELEALIASWKGLLKPEETRVVEISGGSQGGFQAIGVAAILDDVITVCKSQITWLADVTSNTDSSNIPCSFRPKPTKADGAERSSLEYIDSANMAQLIKCETIISPARLGDLTSPPTGIMAMYNNLTRGKAETDGPFSIKFVQGVSHGHTTFSSDSTIQKNIENFINGYCTATIEGALETQVDSWSIKDGVLTVNAKGVIDASTGDALWEADPLFSTVNAIVLGEGVISVLADSFDLAATEVTVKMPSTLNLIADGAFGADADLTKFTIRSYNDTYAQTYAEKNGATFVTLGNIGASGAYAYTINGSVLNLVATSDLAILTADKTLADLAIANAETIKTIEIEGKYAAIGSLKSVLKNCIRVETIKIDTQTTALTEGTAELFAGASNLTAVGHVEFDVSGAPIVDTGTFKKGIVNLSGFDTLCDGILSGARAVTEVVLADANIPAKAFANAISLETVKVGTVAAATIAADAFEGTSGVKIVVDDEASKAVVEDALAASAITNVTVSVGESAGQIGDKTGAAGTTANWKIKGSTLILSGNGVVSKLEGLEESDKAEINNIVISEGITAINDNVIAGFTLEKVSIKGAVPPVANDGVFGVQAADFAVYVTPDATVGATLYGYTVVVDGGTAGDLDGNGEINAVDAVVLAQILANWDVEYNATAADCNGDGDVNAMDSVLLAQYLANWDVQLGIVAGGGDIEIPGGDLLD